MVSWEQKYSFPAPVSRVVSHLAWDAAVFKTSFNFLQWEGKKSVFFIIVVKFAQFWRNL